jgi:Pectate lyase superfamily protein
MANINPISWLPQLAGPVELAAAQNGTAPFVPVWDPVKDVYVAVDPATLVGTGSNTQPSGLAITSYGAQPGGLLDAAPAVRLAMAAAKAAGHFRVALPAGTFRIGSNIRVYDPFIITGAGRELTKLVCDPGIEAAFSFFTGAAAPGGIGAKGAQISRRSTTSTSTRSSRQAPPRR